MYKTPGTAWRSTSSRRTSPGNIKGRGEESHREHEEEKGCRLLKPPDRHYQTPRGECSGHDAGNTEESLGRGTDARRVGEK